MTIQIPNLHSILTNLRENGSMNSSRRDHSTVERFNLRLPLRYRVDLNIVNAAWKHGFTLEISAVDLRIDIPEAVGVNTELELSIDWPGVYHGKERM